MLAHYLFWGGPASVGPGPPLFSSRHRDQDGFWAQGPTPRLAVWGLSEPSSWFFFQIRLWQGRITGRLELQKASLISFKPMHHQAGQGPIECMRSRLSSTQRQVSCCKQLLNNINSNSWHPTHPPSDGELAISLFLQCHQQRWGWQN